MWQSVNHKAKSKQNAPQKPKETPKQTQQCTSSVPMSQKAVPMPVPASQPAKPSSKTSKMRDINLKGATKEGTDMDAFNDNVNATADALNANVTNSDVHENISNAVNANVNVNSSTAASDNNKKNDIVDVPPSKPEVKTLPKGKIDVTDIVKDVPKPLKPFVPVAVESQDEPDRASLINDKLVQAKNEANAKATAENNDVGIIETRSELPYKKDQWSPFNKEGKKVYGKEFLIALRNDPKSRKRPENCPNLDFVVQEDRGRLGDFSRYPVGGRTTDFAPNFSGVNYSKKSSSQRINAPANKHGSQSKLSGGKGSKPNVIKVSISVREDVKLREAENAWKPARFNAAAPLSEDEKKTEELYRKVRGVLNKLTPQKFDTLLTQVRSLTIDTTERLQGVIDLVFEKAVDESNFSVAYALMCRELALMQVPATVSEGKKRDGLEYVNFRKLLVTRCQLEFEKNSMDESRRNDKVKEIEACTDQEKKKEMQIQLGEDDRRMRMKSVGNIRFIGELFKQQMLTVNIMMRCLSNLLDNKDEESLECLCKLLTTIGRELEQREKKLELDTIFNTMKEIVDKKHTKVNSRVRFMLQDVIDLRNCKWVPRRQDLNPKTIDQIQKEADNEQLNIQVMNTVPVTPRKDDRTSARNATDRKRSNMTDDGWSTATSRSRTTPFSVQSDKLKNKPPQMDEPLGSSQLFGNWGRGSNIKTHAPPPNTANMYAALENINTETDKRPVGVRTAGKDPYSSKGPSLERCFKQPYDDGRSSRSGSQQRSRDSSSTSQRSTHSQVPPHLAKSHGSSVPPISQEDLQKQLDRRLKTILEEYLSDCSSVMECDQDLRATFSPATLPMLVSEFYNSVLERSRTARLKTGALFAQLIKIGTLSLDSYCTGLEQVLSSADDLTIDIPKIWDYLAEIIAPLLCEEALLLICLRKSFDLLISQGHAPKLLTPLFKLVIQEKGPNFLQAHWQTSGLSLSDFMPANQVESYVEENKFEYLLYGGGDCSGQSHLSYEQIHDKLLMFFRSNTTFDDILNWITANVGENMKQNQFIRTLVTAVFEHSTVNAKLKPEILREHHHLLVRFIDSNATFELQCLYALQTLINKLEHPQGLLLSIFDRLYEESTISQESFLAWELSKDPSEQEGKGVALKQLTSFFTQLKEADDESVSSASEDA